MKISIHSDLFNRFPDLIIAVVVAAGIDNHRKNENLQKEIQEKEDKIREELFLETLSQHPRIKSWRQAYAAFGAKPKKHKSSIENLYRMVLEGKTLKSINTLVDIYNYVSLKHMIPLGGDDLDKVEGDITLCFARGDESFIPLYSKETEFAKEGEVIYRDNKEVLCRRWNWRECDKTKMTSETKNAALVLEGLPPVRREDIQSAVKDLSVCVLQFCGGETQEFFLDVSRQEREFSFR